MDVSVALQAAEVFSFKEILKSAFDGFWYSWDSIETFLLLWLYFLKGTVSGKIKSLRILIFYWDENQPLLAVAYREASQKGVNEDLKMKFEHFQAD